MVIGIATNIKQWLRDWVHFRIAPQTKSVNYIPVAQSVLADFTQLIAVAELSKVDEDGKLLHQQLIQESIQVAHWKFGKQADATLEELAVELMVDTLPKGMTAPDINLSKRWSPSPSGWPLTSPAFSMSRRTRSWRTTPIKPSRTPRVGLPLLRCPSSQTNPDQLILPGIIAHFKQLAPDFPPCRICIKIPATWEGLQACRELERKGIATLATTLFSLEQTALAADAGCRYVAPYVNELRVHLEPE